MVGVLDGWEFVSGDFGCGDGVGGGCGEMKKSDGAGIYARWPLGTLLTLWGILGLEFLTDGNFQAAANPAQSARL